MPSPRAAFDDIWQVTIAEQRARARPGFTESDAQALVGHLLDYTYPARSSGDDTLDAAFPPKPYGGSAVCLAYHKIAYYSAPGQLAVEIFELLLDNGYSIAVTKDLTLVLSYTP